MAQNNDETEGNNRIIGKPFPKGVSGNPGGRPKGLMRIVREMTQDGFEIAEFMMAVFRGEIKEARLADRIEAAEWLADRGFGKSISISDLETKIANDAFNAKLGIDDLFFGSSTNKLSNGHEPT